MSLAYLEQQLAQKNEEKTVLESRRERLEEALDYVVKLYNGSYVDNYNTLVQYVNSINAVFGGWDWEGQQVGLFEEIYTEKLYSCFLEQNYRFIMIQNTMRLTIDDFESSIDDKQREINTCIQNIAEEKARIAAAAAAAAAAEKRR